MRLGQQDDDLVMNLVEMALASPPGDRRRCIEEACGDDPELFAAVWNYVEWEQRMQGFLLEPLYPSISLDHPFEDDQVLEGRFRIVREVAQGGMGVVYEAVDQKLERRIALKCAKAGFRKRLPPEVRNASDISHPNVCKTFEFHTASTPHGDIDFLTMEFLDGETLAAKLRGGPIPEAEALAIALQLCAGLAEAHRRQVIHGDLKSGNIIIVPEDGGGTRAVITDFGLARRPATTPQFGMQSGPVGGTPDYMAPELWKGQKPSIASDIYALGLILQEMATGRPAPSREERLAAEQPIPHTRWDRIIRCCLDSDPSRRYPNADAVAKALGPRSRRWFAAAAASAVLAVLSGALTYRAATAPEETVHLALLPFTSSADDAALASRLTKETVSQIGRLKGNEHTSLSVIPPSAKADTPEKARAVLGATHVLQGTIRQENGNIILHTSVTNALSLASVKDWRAAYKPEEIRYAPVALAGVVTGTFRLEAVATAISASARQDYLSGLHYLRRNSGVDRALPLLERAAETDPHSPLTHAALAEGQWWKYFTSKDPAWLERAAESLRRAELRNPDLAEVHSIAGLLKVAAGRHEQAETEYLRAVELAPRSSDAYRRLGSVYDALNEREKALAAYGRAVELEPDYYRNHQALGNHYKKQGDYELALKHFRTTVELVPDESAAHFVLGVAYATLGRFPEAEKEFRTALDVGETPEALSALGFVLMYLGRDMDAIPYFRRALSRYPEQYLSWMTLGTAYRRLHLITESERANRRGLELAEIEMRRNPKSGYVRACLSYMSASLGDRRRAESDIAQALQLSPADADTRRMAVRTYELLGRREDALDVLRDSPADVLFDVSRYPDLAGLRRDSRFIDMIASVRGK